MQSKNKNDSVQLPTRYQCYDFAKRHLRGTSRPKVFPIRKTITGTIKIINKAKHSTNRLQSIEGIARTIRANAGGKGAKTGLYLMDSIFSRPHGFNDGGIKEYPNIRESAIHNELVNGIRRLTPTECMRLQGFPDSWVDIGVDFATPVMYNKGYANAKKKNTIEILQTLQEAVSEDKGKGWGFAELVTFLKKEILQPKMYATVLQGNMEKKQCSSTAGELQSKAVNYCNRMYNLWFKQKSGYSSQRQKQIKQLFEKLRGSLSQLPHKVTSPRGWMESTQEKKRERRQVCFKWISDSQKYKMAGNAVTVNVIKAIMLKMLKIKS